MDKLKIFGKVIGESTLEYIFLFVVCSIIVLILYGLGVLVASIFSISLPVAQLIVSVLAGFIILVRKNYSNIKGE